VALLAKIEAQNPSKSIIHVIWDNAPYHRCKQVRAWLSRSNCRINLIRLPTYCPHLNPRSQACKHALPRSDRAPLGHHAPMCHP
jgi:transposase